MSAPKRFGKLRSLLWPIYGHEHRKFVPMFLIFLLICFNYSILRATKDALVVTAPSSGAEALPFLKVWFILPAALLFTFIYTRLSNRFSRVQVFYFMMGIFLTFFLAFSLFLFPYRDTLHPHGLADSLQAILPEGFTGLIAIFRNWTFSAFYIMSEMWSTMIMTVLFWGFANEVTSVKDAKRYYAILGIGANVATMISGQVSYAVSNHIYNPSLPFGNDGWSQSLIILNWVVILAGALCVVIFRYLDRQGLGYSAAEQANRDDAKKVKMGIRKNFAYLAKSKYLICIAVVVLMFNICMTLIEVVWKDQVKILFPNPNDYTAYMGNVLTSLGLVATVGAFVSAAIMRRFTWTASALITPILFLVTGIGFFSFLIFKDTALASLATIMGSTPIAIGVFFGSMQNVLARASKYTIFDATKELSFIPLSQESRMRGKAAIDGFGSRLGKSGASIVHQALIMIFGTISVSIPIVGGFLVVVIGGWIAATRVLGREFHKLTLSDDKLEVKPEEATELPEQEQEVALAGSTETNR